jgi:tRNA-2-methylthio-N6-dimethylallyladenosine synthase
METGLGLKTGPSEKSFIDPQTGETLIKKGDIIFPPRKVWMKTFGCQMNYHDTERILFHLKELNFSFTEEKEDADLILFNTCAIRDLSNLKFYSQLGDTKRIKREKKKDVKIGVGGCVAQTEAKELLKKYEQLDFAFGTDVIDCIGDMVYRAYAGEKKFKVTAWDRSEDFSIDTKITHGTPQAFVNIIKGCNKYCSYCIVPYTRGKERSRKCEEVVKDIQNLVKYQGVQEVTLLGQNVNSYGKENGESLAKLLMELEKIEGLELVRYTTSHPYDVSEELIAVHGKAKKLSNHLHLPVQSGSNTVLQRMLREYTVEHFMGLVDKLRAANPNIVLSTDIIVGFPNESQEEYEKTLELLEKVKFDSIFSYAFSARNGTKAAQMEDSLTDDERGRRLRELQQFQLNIQKETRKELLGKTMRVLVDGKSKLKGIIRWKGRTNCNRIVHFDPHDLEKDYLWNWVDLKITNATALSCNGEIVKVHGRNIRN